jgi:hypothetical protein
MGSNGNLRGMPSRFEHRASFSAPAATVRATLTDRAFLEERLRELGGTGAALTEHRRDGDEVLLRLRQGVPAERLPAMAKAILKGDLVVEREERWGPDGGSGRATIVGVPGEIASRSRLTDSADGSELVITAEVRVAIPLVGGKLEGVIAEQVGRLLTAESEFTGKWLAGQGT